MQPAGGNPPTVQSGSGTYPGQGQVMNPMGYYSGPQQMGPGGVNYPGQQQGIMAHSIQQPGAYGAGGPTSQNYAMYASPQVQPGYNMQQQFPVQANSNPISAAGAVPGLISNQPTSSLSQGAPQRPLESTVSSQQPQTTAGSNPPSSSAPPSQPQQPQQHQHRPKQLNPPPYSPDILDNLESYSVTTLCTIGKEIAHELNFRTTNLCSVIKSISDRKSAPSQDPEVIVNYCLEMLKKLQEVRILIERQRPDNDERAGTILERFMDMSDSYIQKPPLLEEKESKLEENRKKLISLNNDLKFLDWKSAVSDPVHLRNVDSMSIKDYKDKF